MPDRWDPFAEAEAEARAMILDPRWAGLAPADRARALAARILLTDDGDRWLFGAHGRWYLQDPSDGRWHLAAPPRGRPAARIPHASTVVPAPLIPSGQDCVAVPSSTQAFVGPDVADSLTEQVRLLLRANCRRPVETYPLTAFADVFASDVPGTVAAVWGAIVWCAYAPAFDGNERLLTIFGEFLGRPLPGDDWVRWLPSPPLSSLVTLFAERVRAEQHRAALRLVALMADTAHVLAADPRFSPRAEALTAMLEPLLRRPDLDDRAALHGDDAVRHAWLARCPARYDRAVMAERLPGEAFRHAVYDLVEALSFHPERLRFAAAFLSELPDPDDRMPAWLDHRLRVAVAAARPHLPAPQAGTATATLDLPGAAHTAAHTASWELPTGAWTLDDEPRAAERPTGEHHTAAHAVRQPHPALHDLHPPDRETAAAVLGAAYAAALAWCALTGCDTPGNGFAGPAAIAEKIAHERDDPRVNH
ncbi:hypothetical protein [Thermoactinospora rubra]|uniref:hypothetical protein n=1 Tax=Thermoactinospora rubra TaxID=1088767 RepID=UPI00117F4C3F|nr:hypothetical protein [Thermoactinospora rubra]